MFRHLRRTGPGLLLGLAMVVTGCAGNGSGGDDPGGAPATTGAPDADPMSTLTNATDALKREPFKMEMSTAGVMSATGAVDPTAGLAHFTMTEVEAGEEVSIEVLIVGDDIWGSFDGIGMPEDMAKWLHMDATKLPDGLMGLQPGDTDLVDSTELLRGLGTVEQVDEHTFRSELDMTEARSDIIDEQLAATLPEEATMWPVTATIDEQGRLTQLVITFAHLTPPESMEIRYLDYGTPVDVTPPPADQVAEMPEEFYQLFGG